MRDSKAKKKRNVEQAVLADGTNLILLINSEFAYLEFWVNYESFQKVNPIKDLSISAIVETL